MFPLQAYYWLYANLVERFPPQQLALVIVSPDFMSAAYELWRRMTLLVGYEVPPPPIDEPAVEPR